MVSKDSIDKQLKKIDFNPNGWGRGEVNELHHIILPDEEIFECVNGIYEGGFALLLASDIRVLLIDKKPLSFLTVEDLRFDMINEIDYSHRMLGAFIKIATGNKNLLFRSYNKERLRKLIGHVQHCMAATKKQQSSHAEGQNQHLEQINQQLQAYLVTQYKQQQKLHEQLIQSQPQAVLAKPIEPERPPGELSDFLYARGLLDTYQLETGHNLNPFEPDAPTAAVQTAPSLPAANTQATGNGEARVYPWSSAKTVSKSSTQLDEIYADGLQEVFGKRKQPNKTEVKDQLKSPNGFEINPINVAYSKLPMALRNRKFDMARKRPEPAT